jgi:hypothetical protein
MTLDKGIEVTNGKITVKENKNGQPTVIRDNVVIAVLENDELNELIEALSKYKRFTGVRTAKRIMNEFIEEWGE